MSISDVFRSFLGKKRVNDVNASNVPLSSNVTEPPAQNDINLGGDWTLEADLSMRKLASLYAEHGWMWAHTNGVPSADQIAAFILPQVDSIDGKDNTTYSTFGRLMFLKDEEFPGSVDVYLYVGTAFKDDNGEVPVV